VFDKEFLEKLNATNEVNIYDIIILLKLLYLQIISKGRHTGMCFYILQTININNLCSAVQMFFKH